MQGVSDAPLSEAADSSCFRDGPMTTTEAARYSGFKSTAATRKAHREGKLVPIGRRGGTGTHMWSRQVLDSFVAGARGARSTS